MGTLPLLCWLALKLLHQALRPHLTPNLACISPASRLHLACISPVSLLHQALRAGLHRCTSFQRGPEGGRWFTRGTHERWEALRDRHWGSIAMKIAILGVGYLALQVLVMKVVVVLLVKLNQWLEPFSPLVVALAFTLVGTSMF